MHDWCHVLAHAKINLRLRVLAREASGYHGIETVFHKVTLADEVTVTLQPPGTRTIHCNVDVGPDAQNLAYRAAMALVQTLQWDTGFHIEIVKRIPIGGGLGGGSADAAATLHALNDLAPDPLITPALLALAGTLGADVPFLASGAAMALAWGRGDRMLALDALPVRHVVLVVPSFRIATADAYGWIAASRSPNILPPAELLQHWHLANWRELTPWVVNDFEPVVADRHPEIATTIEALRRAGALIAAMTGSGSTLFGIFKEPPALDWLRSQVPGQVILTKTLGGVEGGSTPD